MTLPAIGEKYRPRHTALIQRQRGIARNSVWVITCTDGDKISLSAYSGNQGLGYDLTILKSIFGNNFERVPGNLPPASYKAARHCLEHEVNRAVPIKVK